MKKFFKNNSKLFYILGSLILVVMIGFMVSMLVTPKKSNVSAAQPETWKITVNKTSSEINLSEDGKTDYSIKFKPLSDNRTRIIPITSEIQSILVALHRSNPNAKFIITQRNGDPVSKSYISRVMRECVKEACG